ncbi:MAG: 2-amino-4-hydroxy-6-hydroxymethyldihydropteridine diphosphokinase [Omnitrophica WOR_2 bacterium GWA2_47_8]|nr:MAG: 2-amino-4-hydroxy-6-hydroxymethyldihydropteridine diphosphokinase [Omnitrophica WOR_2 bacterium GWA2_47_8]
MNTAVIGLGSNISPQKNIKAAQDILSKEFNVLAESKFTKTKPVGPIKQPDFLNGAVLISTDLNQQKLKSKLAKIEKKLGRTSLTHHFGPRTIDLDILIFNGRVVEDDFYERDFVRKSVLELLPDLKY